MKNTREYIPESGIEIAVIGMAGRFPGADDLNEYWQMIADAKEAITFFSHEELDELGIDPAQFADESYVKARGMVRDPEYFDASFFGISPRDAEMMDPQHRLFLEISWAALEDAGYDPGRYPGRIGIYAGAGFNSYMVMKLTRDPEFIHQEESLQHLFNNDKDYVATRASYKLDLRGPSVNVQSACSTSLVATHLACQSLISGESDIVMAGGIAIRVPQHSGYWYQRGSIFSADGHCRAYDEAAGGTVCGNGGGVVVLKRLEDAVADGDHIYTTIKSTAINNDGAGKVGFTAPSVDGEAGVILNAQAVAEIDPGTIRYIEGHGSGTALGDPIEIEALTKAFRAGTSDTGYCAVGSVKANIGHLDTAAGVAGLIKASLAVHKGKIPPSANFSAPNPRIDFAKSPFYVSGELQDWPEDGLSRRAGVSSFGIGGTNCHVVLEQAPAQSRSQIEQGEQIIVLSARTRTALRRRCRDLQNHLERQQETGDAPHLADLAFTLQVGRKEFEHRVAFVAGSVEELIRQLALTNAKHYCVGEIPERAPDVVFMFSGQGAQYPEMARQLYESEPAFRRHVDECCDFLHPRLKFDPRSVIALATGNRDIVETQLKETRLAQPTLFVVEYALARLLIGWGIKPKAMIGHSVGEITAACISGVLSLEDSLELVVQRGKLMQSAEPGQMLAVAVSEHDVQPYLSEHISLAAVNTPNACVVAGNTEAIEQLADTLSEQDIVCRVLQTSHAFHSSMMDDVVDPLVAAVKSLTINTPEIPYISNVTGTWITDRDLGNPEYWGRHMRGTVRFSEGVAQLHEEGLSTLFLEVGPGTTLTSFARKCHESAAAINCLPHPKQSISATSHFLMALGKCWSQGANVDWFALHENAQPHRVSLPTYPFERKRYWLDGESGVAQQGTETEVIERRTDSDDAGFASADGADFVAPTNDLEWAVAAIWQELFGISRVGIFNDFFDLGGDSMLAIQLVAQLQSYFEVELPLAEVLQYPTISEQADRVKLARQSGGRIKNRSPLVRIQPKGSKPPFFCVHPAGGIVHCYIEMARLLGKDQPFYALQHPGIDGACEPYTEFDIMAAHYIEAIKEKFPEGPYHIGGWSFGGTVAYEMAQQLTAAGDEVAMLLMMDTPVPSAVYDSEKLRDEFDAAGIFTFLGRGVAQIFGNYVDIDPDALVGLTADEQFDHVLKEAGSINEITGSDEAREQLAQIINMFQVADKAERNYHPKPYDGEIKMLRVNALDDYEFTGYRDHPGIAEPSFGWNKVANVDVRNVEGTHMTMVVNPHVRKVAQILSDCLAETAVNTETKSSETALVD